MKNLLTAVTIILTLGLVSCGPEQQASTTDFPTSEPSDTKQYTTAYGVISGIPTQDKGGGDSLNVTKIVPNTPALKLRRPSGWISFDPQTGAPNSGQITAGFAQWYDWPLGAVNALVLPDATLDITTAGGLRGLVSLTDPSAQMTWQLPAYQEHLDNGVIAAEGWEDIHQPQHGTIRHFDLQDWINTQDALQGLTLSTPVKMSGTTTLIFHLRPMVHAFHLTSNTAYTVTYNGSNPELKAAIGGLQAAQTSLSFSTQTQNYTLSLKASGKTIDITLPLKVTETP